MMNYYSYHNDKLDNYEQYNTLLTKLTDKEYSSEYGPIMHIIKRYPETAFWYARRCLNYRWLEAEQTIMTDSYHAYMYARVIIKGRWPEAEPFIMTDPWHAHCYAYSVIKDRWLEAEPIIMKNDYVWGNYCREFNM